MENILVGISFSEQSDTVMKFALRLAQYHTANLTVVHILDYRKSEVNNIFVPGDKSGAEVHEAFRLIKKEELKSFVKKHYGKQYHTVKIDVEVRFGYSHEELRIAIKESNADLLVLGKFTKTGYFFSSDTSDKLIPYASCPIFIVPEDAIFIAFKRIVYASDFILEDCESLFFLLPWLNAFQAKLICLHVCKNKEEEAKAKRKLATLNKLFPQDNISFRCVTYAVEKGIDRYVELSKSDMVATIHRDRNLWDSLFKPSMSKAIAGDVKVPMLIFQQKKN